MLALPPLQRRSAGRGITMAREGQEPGHTEQAETRSHESGQEGAAGWDGLATSSFSSPCAKPHADGTEAVHPGVLQPPLSPCHPRAPRWPSDPLILRPLGSGFLGPASGNQSYHHFPSQHRPTRPQPSARFLQKPLRPGSTCWAAGQAAWLAWQGGLAAQDGRTRPLRALTPSSRCCFCLLSSPAS